MKFIRDERRLGKREIVAIATLLPSVNKHGAQKPQGLLGTGRMGARGYGGGGRGRVYLSLHCHHQNDFCIKMGSD